MSPGDPGQSVSGRGGQIDNMLSPDPGDRHGFEPGMIRDLIKDAPLKYKDVDEKQLRPVIDHDTLYLGTMDNEQLKMPAKEAGVQVPANANPEHLRRLIRDAIVAAVEDAEPEWHPSKKHSRREKSAILGRRPRQEM